MNEGRKGWRDEWINEMGINWYSRINDGLCYYYFDLFGAWWMAHQYRYLEQDESFSWTDYILFSMIAVPLCVQEICFSHASLGLQKKTKTKTKKTRWASRAGFLWNRRLWWAGQMHLAEQSEEKSYLAFTNSVLPSLKASVSFPKIFWEKPLGKRVVLSQKVTWEQFPVCLFCQLSSCKILPCTQRRLWTSAVLNNL